MALSSSESELLTQTCQNMNIAANTVREVLEMLRSLGNSGVVDIATHNTSSAPHADAANLVHIDTSTNSAYMGAKNSLTSSWADFYPFIIHPTASFNSYNIVIRGVSKGTTSYTGESIANHFALTDSSLNLLSSADAATAGYSASGQRMFRLESTGYTSDATGEAGIYWVLGDKNADSTFGRASLQFYFSGSSYSPIYELSRASFAPFSYQTSVTLGTSGRRFDAIYLSSSPDVGSDRRLKTNIDALGDKAVSFVNALRPVSYKLAVGKTEILETDENGEAVQVEEHPGARTHWGFIAQEVKEAMTQADIEDASVWCLEDKNNAESMQSLRYEELIAPLVKAVQVLAAKVEALEGK